MSDFLRRFSFFLLGLAIGIFILKFFLAKKNVEFDYLPNARTLKSIRNKKTLEYSPEVIQYMTQNQVDFTQVQSLLHNGEVNFKESDVESTPCKTYVIEPTSKTANLVLTVERCDSVATIQKIRLNR